MTDKYQIQSEAFGLSPQLQQTPSCSHSDLPFMLKTKITNFDTCRIFRVLEKTENEPFGGQPFQALAGQAKPAFLVPCCS